MRKAIDGYKEYKNEISFTSDNSYCGRGGNDMIGQINDSPKVSRISSGEDAD
jgi:hypothetical protein